MNKYIIIGIVLVALIAGGVAYSTFSTAFKCEPGMGADREFTVRSVQNEWRFEPETITVDQCDRVKVTMINEDNYDHGVAIHAFGISQRLPAKESIDFEFVASQGGEFDFICSVSCGGGDVTTGPYAGTVRGHFDHIGQFIVNAWESVTQ